MVACGGAADQPAAQQAAPAGGQQQRQAPRAPEPAPAAQAPAVAQAAAPASAAAGAGAAQGQPAAPRAAVAAARHVATDLAPVTVGVPAPFRRGPFAQDRQLQIQRGFSISVFGLVPRARSMAVTPWGELLVTQPNQGQIVGLTDGDGDGVAEQTRVVAQGLECPYGMDFRDGHLYVAQSTRVDRFAFGEPAGFGKAERVVSALPPSGCAPHHYRPLAIDAAGNLYVAFGSSCNVCVEADARRGTVWQYTPDGNGREYARGLRNVVDLQVHPVTGQLWVATNERDSLGDDVPPEPVGPVQEGADYGWPFCFWNGAGWQQDTRVPGRNPTCQGLTPYNGIQAHSAPLGLTFYQGSGGAATSASGATGRVPDDYVGTAFVGLHGSWNRTEGTGFKVVRIPAADGNPAPAEDLIAGWLTGPRGPGDAWGRPVDVKVGVDGALYVSDDVAGAVYRVWWSG
ncbi:MAG: L-sorbosone dehydrogenase [uncultured Chloroflexi bacterium]|uniref:L-sorbosone dehydrogenase n=1 Tax=uncultured Chloroflexota bacterium TaxID=166587 RepID=A0A6J4JLM7_9CHLR|nr:MAG: L-sorbosone dehydrogenase [uncultured Chloroflexota bacterium]